MSPAFYGLLGCLVGNLSLALIASDEWTWLSLIGYVVYTACITYVLWADIKETQRDNNDLNK